MKHILFGVLLFSTQMVIVALLIGYTVNYMFGDTPGSTILSCSLGAIAGGFLGHNTAKLIIKWQKITKSKRLNIRF